MVNDSYRVPQIRSERNDRLLKENRAVLNALGDFHSATEPFET